MKTNAAKEVAALGRMTVGQLKRRYVQAFGEESRSCNRDFLRKRIVWRLQELAQGGITERARRRAEELANDADLRVRVPQGRSVSAGAAPEGTRGGARGSPSSRSAWTSTALRSSSVTAECMTGIVRQSNSAGAAFTDQAGELCFLIPLRLYAIMCLGQGSDTRKSLAKRSYR